MSAPTNVVKGRTWRDMLISLVVLIVPVALLVAFASFVREGRQASVLDPAPVIAQAQAAGRFPVAAPRGLEDGWRPVSANFRTTADGATLRIGYVTPGGDGVQFVTSDVPAQQLLANELGEQARPVGTETIAGRSWQRYSARAGETALVRAEPDHTLIVVGPATLDDLQALAAAIG
ncbi:MAG: DUF4245 domain-containing protein [Dactylosporangium sp.]|nr:DUF4245 domain-containing protein [Dactylosporangium sp.]